MKKVLLIDGNNILHRAYHGLPLLKTSEGRYTNAVFGFLKMLHKIMEQEKPTHVAICFDKGKNTFRHQKYPEYKAQRKPVDPELAEQFPLIREVLTLNGYLCLESDDFEADDLMGTLAKKTAGEGDDAVIFSGDKDLLQVLGEHITVVSGKKQLTDLVKTDEKDFREKYGMTPIRLIDIKGLMGDASDNIPGVAGVGEKTALKLLGTYETVENLYDHLDELPKNKLLEKLTKDKENAFLSKELATIVTDVPLSLCWEDLIPREKDFDQLIPLYRELEFKGFLKDLEAEKPQDLFSDNLLDTAEKERPFSVEIDEKGTFLSREKELGAFSDSAYLYLASRDYRCTRLSWEEDLELIAKVLSDTSIVKCCADLKGLYHQCFRSQVSLCGVSDAVEIMAYLDESNGTSYQIGSLAYHYLNYDTFLFEDEKIYAETALLFELTDKLRHNLEEKGCLGLYNDVELPLVRVLADMEYQGIRVNKETLRQMSEEMGEQLDGIIHRIYDYAGEEFNINSTKQMSEILFEKLQLPKGKKTKTGYSTNNEVLEGLKGFHPIIEEILQYRMLSKLKSTYTDALGKLISPETGHIHTKFLQTVTTTGRLSSADPNLQNIPVRVEEGRRIRKAFVASDEEHILLAADYSQIELRLLAHFSEDPVLIESFIRQEDIHARTAGEIFGVPKDQVDSNMRRAAKAVNFGIIYGISSYSLGNDLGVSRKTAQDYIDGYFARYPNVKNYLDQ
ncbi:MAG: DNA polymerase I, partial [Clostridia bacterium]